MADLSGEVRVSLGIVRQARAEIGRQGSVQEAIAPGQTHGWVFLLHAGAASVLKTLKTAGHDIGPEGDVFLQDHEDETAATQASSRDRRKR